MIRMSVRPACTASSTTYWIAGRSTTGSISFGELFVAGKKRVPSPAAGITALRTAATGAPSLSRRRGCSSAGPRAELVLLASQQPLDVTEVACDDQDRERRQNQQLPEVVAHERRRDREEHGTEQRRDRR